MQDETTHQVELEVAAAAATRAENLSRSLVARVTRAAAIAAVPLAVLAVVYLYYAQRLWLAPLVVLGLGLLLLGARSRASRRLQALALPSALFLVGLLDLAARGWDGQAHLAFLVSAALAALFLDCQAGSVVLAVASAVLGAYIGAIALGWDRSIFPASHASLSSMVAGWGLFALCSALVVLFAQQLVRRSANAVEQAYKSTWLLSEKRRTMSSHLKQVQETNATLERRVSQLDAALSVAREFITVSDLSGLLNRSAEAVAERFAFDEVLIYLAGSPRRADEVDDWVTLVGASDPEGKAMALRGYRVHRGSETLPGRVVEKAQAKLDGHTLRAASFSQAQSALGLPLTVAGQVVGVLTVAEFETGAFQDEDIALLERLAGQLALAIDSARRLSQEAAVLEAASPFYRTANRLAVVETASETYRVVLEALGAFRPERVLIVRAPSRLDDSNGASALQIVAEARGEILDDLEADTLDAARGHHGDARTDRGLAPEGLLDVAVMGLALDTPLWIEDLDALDGDVRESVSPEMRRVLAALRLDSEVLPSASSLIGEGAAISSLALVPILGGRGASKGVIIILYPVLHRFSGPERRLHQLVMEMTGTALERGQLLEVASRRAERERQLLALGTRLRRSTDPAAILRTSVLALGRALGAREGLIQMYSEGPSRPGPDEKRPPDGEAPRTAAPQAPLEGGSDD